MSFPPNRPSHGLSSEDDYTRAKMDAFRKVSQLEQSTRLRKVKPTCVSLMSLAATPPTSHSPHIRLVETLNSLLTSIPTTSLTVSMINYVLFPITQILRHHPPSSLPDLFLESTFQLLAHVVGVWKGMERGMDHGAWKQLLRFTVSSLGPRPGDSTNGGKGKTREIGQEVQLQAVNLLTSLLDPSRSHPTLHMLNSVSTPKSPLMPTLFQTITLLLAMIEPVPPHSLLQLRSIRLIRPIITTYLSGQHPVLASVLPGITSAVSKLMNNAGKSLKGEVAATAAGLVEDVIVSTLSDEDLQRLGVLRGGLDDLSQLADEWNEDATNGSVIDPPPSSTPSSSSYTPNPFPPLTFSYLEFTSKQLVIALRPLLTSLKSHRSHLARRAAASLSAAVISQCNLSLPTLVPFALSTLLLLSRDDFDPVRHDVNQRLRNLSHSTLDLHTLLVDLLTEAINALPRLITSDQEIKVQEAAKVLTAIAETTMHIFHRGSNPLAELLGPRGKVERWGWALLSCLEFGRPTSWSTMDDTAARASEKGWKNRLVTSSIPLIESAEGNTASEFPDLPMRLIESEATVRAIRDTLIALGSAGGEPALHSVEHFAHFARSNRGGDTSKAVSALWVAQHLFDGIAKGQEESAEGRVSKATRKMARDVTRVVVTMDDMDDDDQEEDDAPVEQDESDALVAVERTKGVDTITTLLDRDPLENSYAAKETRRLHKQAQRALLTALSLSTLSLTSRILSSSFRPLLLNALYTLLSHLTSPHSIIATYAEVALSQVAYDTGYASVQNLILDNVDYVINVVSQRLTPSRLSSSAPLVLIAMIRLTGSEIVPMVHDVIDEIFDALDDYHGYEVIASGLLAALVALIDVMAVDVAAEGPSEERRKKLAEFNRVGKPPDPIGDFARFKVWYEERDKRRREQVESILERAPEHAWGKDKVGDDQGQEGADKGDGDVPMDDSDPPPTRTQQVCAQIIDKSLNFLSHRSSFLRARVLSLISRATPVLAMGNREGDLLPLIDRSWSIILLRLDDNVPYVVTEAAEVIAALCEHCGDFMSRRILDTAWPKFKKLLNAQYELDKKSALARKSGMVGTESGYTVSHRLHVAILSVATFVASDVPVEDGVLWDMMVMFRPFLDIKVHEELQEKAMGLYGVLEERDGDALWVVLNATRGVLGGVEGIWNYLREDRLDIQTNSDLLLTEL